MKCPHCNKEITYSIYDLKKLEAAWNRCLGAFGINRSIFPAELEALDKKVRFYGEEAVFLCIIGARYEKQSSEFDPIYHLTLPRIFKENNFMRLVNVGSMKIDESKRRALQQKKMEEIAAYEPEVGSKWTPEKVEEFRARFRREGPTVPCVDPDQNGKKENRKDSIPSEI